MGTEATLRPNSR